MTEHLTHSRHRAGAVQARFYRHRHGAPSLTRKDPQARIWWLFWWLFRASRSLLLPSFPWPHTYPRKERSPPFGGLFGGGPGGARTRGHLIKSQMLFH